MQTIVNKSPIVAIAGVVTLSGSALRLTAINTIKTVNTVKSKPAREPAVNVIIITLKGSIANPNTMQMQQAKKPANKESKALSIKDAFKFSLTSRLKIFLVFTRPKWNAEPNLAPSAPLILPRRSSSGGIIRISPGTVSKAELSVANMLPPEKSIITRTKNISKLSRKILFVILFLNLCLDTNKNSFQE